jgi:hypothetical protein
VKVELRRPAGDDRQWLESWLPDAARPLGWDADLGAGTVLIIVRDGARAGATVHRRRAGTAEAVVEVVAMAPQHARHGAGLAAAALLETRLRADGVRRVYAPAPAAHGIAVYFWIRLGYRPLLRGDWPCARPGVAWLARDL